MAGVFYKSGSLTAKASCVKIIIILLAWESAQAASTGSSTNDLWYNPCSTHTQQRHPRSAAVRELNFTFQRIVNSFSELRSLYDKNIRKQDFPNNIKCPKLNKLLRHIRKAKVLPEAHKYFHSALYELTIYLDKLKNIQINTHAKFNKEKRKRIYEDTSYTLRTVICEFQEMIWKNPGQMEMPAPPQVDTSCIADVADLSTTQMLDIQFFRKLKRFLRQGKKQLRRMKRNKKSKSGKKLKKRTS